MLNIQFGETPGAVYDTAAYFAQAYQPEWITDELSMQMIRDVDKSEVLGPRVIESPVLGPIPPTQLSGGVKTLILMAHDRSNVYNASTCGDNCAKWICRIAKEKDLTINLHHVMDFSSCDDFEARMVNTGRTVSSYEEYLDEALGIEER